MPRPEALRAKSAVRSGERCADVTSISYTMPNSSSALAASRMISRSESLPITIETTGLLIRSPRIFRALLHKNAGGDVFAVVGSVEVDFLDRQVGAGNRV